MSANRDKVMPTTERVASVLTEAPTLRSAAYRLDVSEWWLRKVAAERDELKTAYAACVARGKRKAIRAKHGLRGGWSNQLFPAPAEVAK